MIRLSLILCLLTTSAFAQDRESLPEIPMDEIPIQKKLLPYTNPVSEITEGEDPVILQVQQQVQQQVQPIELHENEILGRISGIYRTHLSGIDALVQDDPVGAERFINDAISSIQSLMDDYAEIRENRRFRELYRSVMAEYREFYNISGSLNQIEGDVFEIHEELFSEMDEWPGEEYDMPENVNFQTTDVPLVQNQQVSRHLMYYTIRRPEVMNRWLERSEKFFPMMTDIFEEEGVPTELIHLSMIESGLVPTARSWAAAVGLWQFIRATGAMYGLEVNWWIDERRDPVKATRAAARHLKDLHNIWGDWHLAMANYNISPRGLRRAINAAGGVEDYWAAYPYLPRETRGYVPGFIAATMIAMNPEEFGFQRRYGGESWQYDIVEVDGLMPLDKLAEAAGTTTQELKEYNPELLRWATPPGDYYPLKIPAGIEDEFMAAYNEIPQEERSEEVAMHTVSRGETLGQIARRYGTSVRALFSTNERLSTTIHPGQTIVVPVAGGAMEQIASDRPSNSPSSSSSNRRSQRTQAQAPPNTSPVTYSVKNGDTIGHIAEWFDVRSWQIRAWNGIGNVIRAGQDLTVHVPGNRVNFYRQMENLSFSQKEELQRLQRQGENIYSHSLVSDSGRSSSSGGGTVTYTVQRNDTLTDIASSHGVSVADIQRVNDLRGTRIYPGQTLEIRTR
ncbi:MAG: LysM peptidoglycan-binding domain-containing protein [Balneolaceae bacterium]